MKKLLLLVAFLLLPSLAQAEEKHKTLTHAVIASNIVAHFVDATTTQWAMGYNEGKGQRLFKEANPIMRWAASSPTKMAIVKGIGASTQTYIWVKYHKKHPKKVLVTAILSTALTGWVAHKNAEQIRNIKQ